MADGKYPVSVYDGAVSIRDKHGNELTDPSEVKSARKELTHDLGELPDIGPEHFESLEDYQQWVMDGAQRFMAS
jgi:hypothetical protein